MKKIFLFVSCGVSIIASLQGAIGESRITFGVSSESVVDEQPQVVLERDQSPDRPKKICCGCDLGDCRCVRTCINHFLPRHDRPHATTARCCTKECSCFDLRDNPSGPFSCDACNVISQCLVRSVCCAQDGKTGSQASQRSYCLHDCLCILPLFLCCCSCYWARFEGDNEKRTHDDGPYEEDGNCALRCLDWLTHSRRSVDENTARPTSTQARCCSGECSCFDLRAKPSGPFKSECATRVSQSLVYAACCPFNQCCLLEREMGKNLRRSGWYDFPLTAPCAFFSCGCCFAMFEVDKDSDQSVS